MIAAAEMSRIRIAEMLIGAGANLDLINKQHRTALILFTMKGKADIVSLLVATGAKLD